MLKACLPKLTQHARDVLPRCVYFFLIRETGHTKLVS